NSSDPCKMYARNKRNMMFENGITDTEENENNFNLLKRRRRNICSTSDSESDSVENDAENTKCNITWTSKNFMPQIHTFSTRNSGIKKKLPRLASILDYFELFISEELVQYIADETNDYHNGLRRTYRWRFWIEGNGDEFPLGAGSRPDSETMTLDGREKSSVAISLAVKIAH
ncbi:unnamed protein product, partial [Heterotrigona itama]